MIHIQIHFEEYLSGNTCASSGWISLCKVHEMSVLTLALQKTQMEKDSLTSFTYGLLDNQLQSESNALFVI